MENDEQAYSGCCSFPINSRLSSNACLISFVLDSPSWQRVRGSKQKYVLHQPGCHQQNWRSN